MLDDFNQRLAIAKSNLRQKNKLDSMLRSTQNSLAAAKSKRTKLQRILAKEQSDVDALEGMTITGLFHALLGSKQQRLEKERQELVAAKLQYDQAVDTANDLGDEAIRLKEALSQLENADAQYEQVLAEKAGHLAANESEIASTLIELTHQIADLTADQKELVEAAEAGQSALRSVEKIQATLASAATWGALDMFGGGLLTTMAKHSKMDAAKNQARIAQRQLLRFEEELADADQRLQLSLKIDGFSKFADYFFDGLISDWIVQSKIQKAKAECCQTISRVKTALRQCESRLETVRSEINTLAERKRDLIEAA
ncbi:Chromosome partition protein Smc [Rubripirellula lacrimiformis]|uniref:Chromosome partition protein Smc n=1 Tax=Rubripirellula lacrimiformis TaxID=1930273 RepID=A0A517NIV3_9BACT|nr:hypothetical protein [Rubripirellula lacrimiformis]QDT07062.1 Chromosome partition protein Smc [Rubripirellula lacrimiformis]